MIDEIDGVAIDVSRTGEGGPVVIFVHGLGCDQGDWRLQINALAPQFQCVTFDLPGHGRSALPASGGIEELARVLAGVIARYGRKGCVLVGHSLGCRIILEASSLSSETRQLIRAIAFLEQSLVTGGDPAKVESVIDAVALRIDNSSIHEFLRPAFAAMFVAGSDPKLKETVLARLDRLDSRFARELLLSATRWESRAAEQLAGLHMPMLLVQSTYLDAQFQWHPLEPGMSTPWIDLVKASVSDCDVRILIGSGHFSPVEAADKVNECLLHFLNKTRSASRQSHVGD